MMIQNDAKLSCFCLFFYVLITSLKITQNALKSSALVSLKQEISLGKHEDEY